MAEKVIIDVDIDNKGAVKATQDLTSSIVDQTDAIKDTNDEIKKLEKSNKDLATQNKDLNDQIKKGAIGRVEGNKQIEANSKAIDTNKAKIKQNKVEVIAQKDALSKTKAERKSAIKTMKAEEGSIDALRAQNAKLTKARNAVNLTTKEGQTRLKEINAELDKNNDTIKSNTDELTQQRINIGNYKSAFEGLPGPIKTVQTAFTTLLANPFFAVIAGLVLTLKFLKEAFTRSAEGQDALAKGMGFLKGLVVIVEKAFDKLAKIVISAFEDPQQAVKDLWEGIKENFINRLEGALGFFKSAGAIIKSIFTLDFDALKDQFTDLGKALVKATTGFEVEDIVEGFNKIKDIVTDTIKESQRLEQATLDARRADISAITRIAVLEGEVAKARLDAADKLKNTEKRLEALAVAEQKSIDLINTQIGLAQTRLSIKIAENAQANSGLETLEEQANLEAQIIRLGNQKSAELRTFGKLQAGILDEQIDKELKQAQASAKLKAKSRDEELALLVASFDKILEAENITARKRIDIEKLRSDSVAAINKIAQDEKEALDKRNTEALEERLEIEKEIVNEDRLEAAETDVERFEIEQEIAQERFNAEQTALEDALELKKITLEEFNLGQIKNQRKFNKDTAKIQKKADGAELKAVIKKIDKIADDTQKGADALFSIIDASLNLQFQKLDDTHNKERASLQKKLDDGLISQDEFDKESLALDRKQALEKHKLDVKKFKADQAKSVVEILINTAKGVGQALGAFPPPASFAFAAAVGILGGIQLANVLSKDPPPAPSFAEGGSIIQGKSHAQGGEDVYVGGRLMGNVQGGEGLFITKREATMDALSHINKSFGGRGFSSSVNSRFYQEGGGMKDIGENISLEQMTAAFTEAVSELPQPVVLVSDIQMGMETTEEAIGVTSV